MLHKRKSKKLFELKYLLLVPMVLSMFFYYAMANTGVLASTTQIQDIDDAALIKKVQTEIDKEVFEFGSFNDAYYNSSTFKEFFSPETIPTKEQFFRAQIYTRMFFTNMDDRMDEKKNKSTKKILSTRFPLPSTALYENYINRKKAFQILDQNFKASISAYSNEVVLLNTPEEYPEDYTTVKVIDVKNLSVDEVRNFNRIMDDISKNNKVESIVITDGNYAFHMYQKEFIRVEEYEALALPNYQVLRNEGTITLQVADVENLTFEEIAKRKELIAEILEATIYETLVITDGKLKKIVNSATLIKDNNANINAPKQ
jgi:hypothetical protein